MQRIKKQLVHYDKEADVLALYMGKGREEEAVEIAPNISVELNKAGVVIGVEIINASKVLLPFLRSMKKERLVGHA